jgi:sugar lactone lactonase YvrE
VAVSAVAVTGVTLSNTAPNLEPGGTITLVPTVTPVGATNKAVTWASSNTAVATVDATGKVTAVAEGSAIITVTTVDGGKTATANVGVTLAPTISSFAPASAAFGETVTITGTNFGSLPGDNSVTFNNVPATVVSATATELQVTVPQNLLSGGPVRVAVAGKTGVSPSNFTYVRTWTVSTLAGGTQGSADGLKEAAQFEYPEGVEVDSEGNVYVADTDNSTIRKITPGGLVTTFAGSTGGFADGPRLDARFAVPRSLAIGEGGVIYVADWGNRRIRMITPDGVVTTLESDIDPVDIAVGPTGNLYIVDRENNRILVRSPDGQVAILAGGTQGSANGNGAAAQFNAPYGIALDAAGNAYVADTNNDLIRKITPDGDVTTLAGSIAGFRDGIGSEAQFDKPKGVAVDEAGNVFIGGGFNNSIRMITPDGVVSTIAGEAQFSFPYGVAFDSDGNLYVADRVNSAIRVLTPQ